MGGFELVRHLRGDPRTESVSIILITARPADRRADGTDRRRDDYIVNPFDNEQLLAASPGRSAAPST
jgi:DNA-binding response OmpR family regulator